MREASGEVSHRRIRRSRHHDPRVPQLGTLSLRGPLIDRQIEDAVAGRARLSDQGGQAFAAGIASPHLAPFEAHAGTLGNAVVDTDLLEGLAYGHEREDS